MHTKIWTAIHTPFHEDGAIDFSGIRRNVETYVRLGIEGLFCNGLFGERWAINADERIAIAKTVHEAAAGRAEVCSVATIGSKEETIELGKSYKKIGLEYTCLITPNQPKPHKELVTYFTSLMDKIDMPFVLFNSITPEGSVMTPQAFEEISQNPNVKILKTTASDKTNTALSKAARPGVMVADPTEEKFFINATQNQQAIMFSDPEPYLYQREQFRPIERYVRLLDQGEIIEAKNIFEALQPLREVYNYWFLKPFYDGIMTMAYLKKLAEIAGLVGGAVREPLKPVSPEEGAEIEHQFHSAMRKVQENLEGLL